MTLARVLGRRPFGLGGLLVAAALALPAGATASTVSINAGTLTLSAGNGELNQVTIEKAGPFFRVFDDTATLTTSDPACTAFSAHFSRCAAAGVTDLSAVLRDQNDTATLLGSTPGTLSGGSGFDSLQGDSGADTLLAGPGSSQGFGNDVLSGDEGADVLRGTTSVSSGSPVLNGGEGDDMLLGGPSAEQLSGDAGADLIQGGDSLSDTVTYASSGVGVTVTLDDVANDGAPGEGDDVRSDVENIQGSSSADDLTGSPVSNSISGIGGDDMIRGAGGPDFLDGGGESDTLNAGVGDDFISGGFGPVGADTFIGGPGLDLASFGDHFDAATPLTITVNDVANDGAPGEGDDVRTDVENVQGGQGPDTITGSDADNQLEGAGGNDDLRGVDGDDRLFGGFTFDNSIVGDDTLTGGLGDDLLGGGPGADALRGAGGFDTATYTNVSNPLVITVDDVANDGTAGEGDNVRTDVEAVLGGLGADEITGSPGNDVLMGGGGPDTLDGAGADDLLDGEIPGFFIFTSAGDTFVGGPGTDGVSYGSHFGSVTADIDNVADDGQSGEGDDVRTTVENLFGSAGNDTLTGSNVANVLDGGAGFGSDTLSGAAGGDFLSGGLSFDTLNGDAGNDRLHSRGDGSADADNCGAASDTVEADSFDAVNVDCESVFNTGPSRGSSGGTLERSWRATKRRLALAREAIERLPRSRAGGR